MIILIIVILFVSFVYLKIFVPSENVERREIEDNDRDKYSKDDKASENKEKSEMDAEDEDDVGFTRLRVNVRRPDSSIVKGVLLGKLRNARELSVMK